MPERPDVAARPEQAPALHAAAVTGLAWMARVPARVEAVTGFVPQFRHGAWQPAVERVASITFVGSLPDDERVELLAEVAVLVPRET